MAVNPRRTARRARSASLGECPVFQGGCCGSNTVFSGVFLIAALLGVRPVRSLQHTDGGQEKEILLRPLRKQCRREGGKPWVENRKARRKPLRQLKKG